MAVSRVLALYLRMRLEFYRKVFLRVRERNGSLSAMDVFALEVINALNKPTISQFARFIGISQSNATYKVHSLMRKGYLLRQPSDEDGREYNLEMSEKFYVYSDMFEQDARSIAAAVISNLDEDELRVLTKIEDIIEREMDRTYGRDITKQHLPQ